MSERKAECQCGHSKPSEGCDGCSHLPWAFAASPKKIRPQLRGRDSDVEARMHLPMKWESSLVRGNDRNVGSDRILKEFEQLALICEQETNGK